MSETGPGVLVVDDEFSVRDSLAQWFRRDGYRTAGAADAAQALARHGFLVGAARTAASSGT